MNASDGRPVITAVEACSPLGSTLDAAWSRIVAGESAAGVIENDVLSRWPGRWLGAKLPGDAGGAPHRAVVSSLIETAGLDPAATGLCVGASKGDLAAAADVAAASPSAVLDDLRGRHDFGGPATCVVAACASGLTAVMQAGRWLREGRCEAVVVGAADYSLNPLVMASYRRAGVLSSWEGDPAGATRPFAADRSGFVIGEGCGFLVMESAASARRRGATPLAVVSGACSYTDPTALMSLDPTGRTVAATVAGAIADAGLSAGDLSAVCCHGTGTPLNDRTESAGLRSALGDRLDSLPCFSLKGALGHTLGASGGLELAVCVRAISEQTLPPHLNGSPRDESCPIGPLLPSATHRPIRHILKAAFGFGGPVATVVVSSPDGETSAGVTQ